jgi:antitoxin HicB
MKTTRTKKILNTYAIFDPAEEGGYNVSFPTFPGCVTFGADLKEAKEKAIEALSLWIEELKSEKRPITLKSARPLVDEISLAI